MLKQAVKYQLFLVLKVGIQTKKKIITHGCHKLETTGPGF